MEEVEVERRDMLVGITGTCGSGRRTAIAYLETKGFSRLENTDKALESVVSRWREHFVVLIGDGEPSPEISKRPWFVHLHIEAPETLRRSRVRDEFVEESGPLLKAKLRNSRAAHICIVNAYDTKREFWDELDKLDLLDTERVRPSWDRYFMTIADLAAQRSNCMKRRVGCVLVYENRIVATGYNGTPRGCLNCNEGGCERCNSGSQRGALLSTCLCLHAEENALLEAGRLRVANSILYCNTCPCLTCSIKIVQTGVREVVYSQEYSMDGESARVLQNGGVQLRKYGA